MKYPVTQAVRFLREKGVSFTPHLFRYEEKGGTGHSSRALGVDEHRVIKTLIFETSDDDTVAVLMHGDRSVSEKGLARYLEVKNVGPANPETAFRVTGYVFGGTSPFGMRTRLRVLAEASILDLDRIFINGGKRGFLVEIDPAELKRTLDLEPVSVAV